jgi:MFS family permease
MASQRLLLKTNARSNSSEAARAICHIRLLYFLEGFSAASFGRFATLFFLDRGLDAKQIGIIEAATCVARFTGNSFGGYIADRLQRKKAVYLVGRGLSTIVLLLLTLHRVQCCFESILAVMLALSVCGVGGGVLDAYCLDTLGDERRQEYGRSRLWLAVSWGVGNAAMGAVAQVSFTYNFILYGVLSGLSVLCIAWMLPARTSGERRRAAARASSAAAAAAPDGPPADATWLELQRDALLAFLARPFFDAVGLVYIFLVIGVGARTPSERAPVACDGTCVARGMRSRERLPLHGRRLVLLYDVRLAHDPAAVGGGLDVQPVDPVPVRPLLLPRAHDAAVAPGQLPAPRRRRRAAVRRRPRPVRPADTADLVPHPPAHARRADRLLDAQLHLPVRRTTAAPTARRRHRAAARLHAASAPVLPAGTPTSGAASRTPRTPPPTRGRARCCATSSSVSRSPSASAAPSRSCSWSRACTRRA